MPSPPRGTDGRKGGRTGGRGVYPHRTHHLRRRRRFGRRRRCSVKVPRQSASAAQRPHPRGEDHEIAGAVSLNSVPGGRRYAPRQDIVQLLVFVWFFFAFPPLHDTRFHRIPKERRSLRRVKPQGTEGREGGRTRVRGVYPPRARHRLHRRRFRSSSTLFGPPSSRYSRQLRRSVHTLAAKTMRSRGRYPSNLAPTDVRTHLNRTSSVAAFYLPFPPPVFIVSTNLQNKSTERLTEVIEGQHKIRERTHSQKILAGTDICVPKPHDSDTHIGIISDNEDTTSMTSSETK